MMPIADPPRLTPGCHLYEGTDGVWRYYLPGDRFVRITAPAPVLRETRGVLHGHRRGQISADGQALISALAGQGVLAGERPPPRSGDLAVLGEGAVAEAVTALLSTTHRVTRDPAGLRAGLDVAVSCAGWLPDAAWQALDRTCDELGIAWHGCYAEGTRWFVGPMAVPGRTARYRDTRARRLGACGVPQELLAHWSYLDAGDELPPVPWPGAGVIALLAGVIVADIESYLSTGAAAADGWQLEIDPATLAVTRRPVLPLPPTAAGQ